MEREVIVVGAGPCGAAASAVLARLGHDVLMLDRQSFPRDKTCGDSIPAGAVETLRQLGLGERIGSARFHPVRRILIASPRGFELEMDLTPAQDGTAGSYVVPRRIFDHLIQQYAVDCGAEFRMATVTAPLIEYGRVVGVRIRSDGGRSDLRSKVVIGADGASSVISRALGGNRVSDRHRAVALRCYIKGLQVDTDRLEFHLLTSLRPGYAWIFPLGDGQVNVGLGMRLDRYRRGRHDLAAMLETFLATPRIQERLVGEAQVHGRSAWVLELGSRHVRRAYDGVLLIGDAAGLVNPLTGGGIRNGLTSAVLAAQVIHQSLASGDPSLRIMRRYDRLCHQAVNTEMRLSNLLQQVLRHLPGLADLMVAWGGSRIGPWSRPNSGSRL